MRDVEVYDLLKGAAEAGFAIAPDGVVRFWNEAAEKLLGVPGKKACGRYCFEVIQGFGTAGEPVCSPDCSVLELARAGKPVPSFDLEACGAIPKCWVNVSTLVAPATTGMLVIHLLRNINARKRLEQVTRKFLEAVCSLTGHEVEDLLNAGTVPHLEITERERQVLDLLAQGAGTQEIARKLEITKATVRNHIQHLLVKLHAHSRTEAVLQSMRERLI
ncbi:MAG: PAS domain-containing protein [Bryobacterales bacterium]|nr:PAS domain-containing protein [Bryobacterales bacterium]